METLRICRGKGCLGSLIALVEEVTFGKLDIRLARHLLQDGSWHEIIEICQVILARDNCWEAAYRLLMQVYAAQGNHTLLHSTYQRCSATLQEELGLEPSPSTQALFERLKNQEYST